MNRSISRFCFAIALTIVSFHARAQSTSASANFGTFYEAAGGAHNVNVLPHASGGTYTISSGQNFQTPVGTVTVPATWNNQTGQQTVPLTVSFSPNGQNGTFSGSFTASYTNSSGSRQPLNLTVNVSGNSLLPIAQAAPKYQVLSILYTPPGNASSTGFSNQSSAGVSTSVANNFSTNNSITFKAGLFGASNSTTFSVGTSTNIMGGYAVSYQATSGSQLSSVRQAVDHMQDQVYLWINPSITVVQTGDTTGYYNLGAVDANGNYSTNPTMDIVNVNIAGLLNPSLIPLQILEPQTTSPGVTLPGLASVCANPLPVSACTQANACGCVPSDFATIVAQDELANVTDQTIAPSNLDPARFVYVDFVSLQGPQQQGAGPVKNTFSLSDANMSSTQLGQGESYGVTFTHTFSTPGGAAVPTLGISTSNQFTYAHTETAGNNSGTSHTGTVTLGTSNVACSEYVDIYEDTVYHTFAYALPTVPPANCQ